MRSLVQVQSPDHSLVCRGRSSSAPRWRCWFRQRRRGRRANQGDDQGCRGRQRPPGPGSGHPAFAALHRGDTVRVEERTGQWALVVLRERRARLHQRRLHRSGARSDDPEAAPTEIAAETPAGEATPEPTATVVAAAPPAIDRELAALRERLASLEASMQQGGAGSHGHAVRGRKAASSRRRRCRAMVEPPATLDVGPSLALAGVRTGGRVPHRHVLRIAAGAQPPYPRSLLTSSTLVSALTSLPGCWAMPRVWAGPSTGPQVPTGHFLSAGHGIAVAHLVPGAVFTLNQGPVDVEMEPDRLYWGIQTMTRNVRFESQERLACAQPSRVSSFGSFIRLVVDVTMVHERVKMVVGVGSEVHRGRASGLVACEDPARFTPLGTLA